MIKIDEKHLEDILFQYMQSAEGLGVLASRGLPLSHYENSKLFRQFNLKEYGIADIVRISFYGCSIIIEVIELKVTPFCPSHLLQLGRYISCFKNIAQTLGKNDCRVHVKGKLIVSGFDRGENTWFDYLLDHRIKVYTTEYSMDGISFKDVFTHQWQRAESDHSPSTYFNINELIPLFKNEYRSYQIERESIDNFF